MKISRILKKLQTNQSAIDRLSSKTTEKFDNFATRASRQRKISALLLAVILFIGLYAPQIAYAVDLSSHVPPPRAMPAQVRKGACGVKIISPEMELSTDPTDLELRTARVFQEPLVPSTLPVVAGENAALANALREYKTQTVPGNIESINKFIHEYPKSRWLPSLELNVAQKRYESGYTSEALNLWKAVWEQAKSERKSEIKALADEALSQFLILDARLGRTKELESYSLVIKNRAFRGSADFRIKQAALGLNFQKNFPGRAYKCGPFAINSIVNIKNKTTHVRNPIVDKCKSTEQGTNLQQVKQLADKVGLSYQMAKRSAGAPMIYPSVVH